MPLDVPFFLPSHFDREILFVAKLEIKCSSLIEDEIHKQMNHDRDTESDNALDFQMKFDKIAIIDLWMYSHKHKLYVKVDGMDISGRYLG